MAVYYIAVKCACPFGPMVVSVPVRMLTTQSNDFSLGHDDMRVPIGSYWASLSGDRQRRVDG